MIEEYCNQDATWLHKIGQDKHAQAVYAPEAVIRVNKQQKMKLVRDKQGVQVMSNTTYYTSSPVTVDDLLDAVTVIAVNTMTDISGVVYGYEVMT